MIRKTVHIIFALALLLALAPPPALAAKPSAELFLQIGHTSGVNSCEFQSEHCRQAACFKK